MTVQFRAESFNLFNYPQFGQPNATIGSGTAELAPEGKLAVVTPRTDGAEGLAPGLAHKTKSPYDRLIPSLRLWTRQTKRLIRGAHFDG